MLRELRDFGGGLCGKAAVAVCACDEDAIAAPPLPLALALLLLGCVGLPTVDAPIPNPRALALPSLLRLCIE